MTTTVTRLYTGPDGPVSTPGEAEVAWRPADVARRAQRVRVRESHRRAVSALAARLRLGGPPRRRNAGNLVVVGDDGSVDIVGGPSVQLTPGRVLLAEDVTGKGHTTRVGPDEDLVMLLVPIAPAP